MYWNNKTLEYTIHNKQIYYRGVHKLFHVKESNFI